MPGYGPGRRNRQDQVQDADYTQSPLVDPPPPPPKPSNREAIFSCPSCQINRFMSLALIVYPPHSNNFAVCVHFKP